MNIAILTLVGGEFRGGVEKFNSSLKNALERNGHTAEIFAYNGIVKDSANNLQSILWNRTPYGGYHKAGVLAREFSKREKEFDLAIANDFFGLCVKNTPVVMVMHGYYGDIFDCIRRRISFPYWMWGQELGRVQRAALKKADLVVTPSNRNFGQLKSRGLKVDKVIMHGIDTEHYAPIINPRQKLRALQLPDDFLLYVGSRAPWKNFGMVRRASDDYGVAAVAAPESGTNINFLSEVGDGKMPALYSAAQMLLHPSLHEGFCYAVAESMACGTPALFTMTGFGPEICREIPEMIVKNPDDYAEIRGAIGNIIAERKSLSKKSRKFVEKHLNMKKWGKEWLSVVEGFE